MSVESGRVCRRESHARPRILLKTTISILRFIWLSHVSQVRFSVLIFGIVDPSAKAFASKANPQQLKFRGIIAKTDNF